MARIRLIRKLALSMNGIDVSETKVGDIIELDEPRAEMMVQLGWAAREPDAGITVSDGEAYARPPRNR